MAFLKGFVILSTNVILEKIVFIFTSVISFRGFVIISTNIVLLKGIVILSSNGMPPSAKRAH